MGTGTATPPRPKPAPTTTSPYERAWTVAVALTTTGWVTLAVLHAAWLPLAALVAMLGGYGGLLTARDSVLSAKGRRQFLFGSASASVALLVVVGMSRYPGTALTIAGILGAGSPPLLHRIARDRVAR